ncbi:hypothetical protein CVT24_005613 [Panaeolus cyanescens]|uniref:F-box domain-containing protein n=1 Tax=Panaeolus cyanescens TaxID=181874 RepID=A0A409YXX0_9AGAR|nr:hypothetical protein CVT24_005613 [Panaeolus cyanescens]
MTASSEHQVETQTFPVELLHLIFENLDSSDLKACSLVAKLWASLCRPYLFKKVDLSPYFSQKTKKIVIKRIARLAILFKKYPNLIDSIRLINFTLPRVPFAWHPRKVNVDGPAIPNSLSTVIQLPKVQTLNILLWECGITTREAYHAGTQYLGWRILLDRCIEGNQLTTVSLSGLSNLPILPILSCQKLTSLSMVCCHMMDVTSSLPALLAEKRGFALKHLKLRYVENMPLSLLSLCSFLQTIEELHESAFSQVESGVSIPYSSRFPNVTSLDINNVVGWDRRTSFPAVTSLTISGSFNGLPRFGNLEKLHLSFSDDLESDTYQDEHWDELSQIIHESRFHLTDISFNVFSESDACPSLRGIQTLLSSIKGKNALRSFGIRMEELVTDADEWWLTSYHSWKQLGDTLGSISDFPHLQEVSFSLLVEASLSTKEDVQEALEEHGLAGGIRVVAGFLCKSP